MDDTVPHVDAIAVPGPATPPRPSAPNTHTPLPPEPAVAPPAAPAASPFASDRSLRVLAGLFAVSSVVAVVPVVFFLRVLIDQATVVDPSQPWDVLIFGTGGFAVLAAAFRYGATGLADHVGRRVVIRAADALTRSTSGDGRWVDTDTVRAAVSSAFVGRPLAAAAVVVGCGGLPVMHPVLATVALGLGVAAVVVGVVASRRTEAITAAGRLGRWVDTVSSAPATLRAGPGHVIALERTAALTTAWDRAASSGPAKRRRVVMFVFLAGSGCAVVGAAGELLAGGWLSAGAFVAALVFGGLAVYGIATLASTAAAGATLRDISDRLALAPDAPREPGVPLPATDLGMEVRVRGVSFPPRLAGPVTWNVRPRQRVGVVGKSGGGKSTLLDLISGALPPAAGGVELDGLDVRSLDPASVDSQVMTVRGVGFFPGTVRDNLMLSRPVDAAAVDRALAKAGLTAVVEKLPDGLDATLDWDGAPLTPGQALRLTLARALVARPRLLLLDAALDGLPFGEFPELVLALFDRAAPWTLIVASSDPRVLSRCEATLNLTGGDRPPSRVRPALDTRPHGSA